MIVKKGEEHKHKFAAPKQAKVLLHDPDGGTTGYDMLKQRVCACGAVETYDLERTVV